MHPVLNNLSRRRFLQASAAAASLAIGPFAVGQKPGTAEPTWHNVEDWGVEGRGFDDTAKYYDRLPARAEKRVRQPVWDLSRHSAGMATRFKTNSDSIHVRYRLSRDQLAMPHMPATGVSGVDLYARDDTPDANKTINPKEPWRWAAVAMPRSQSVTTRLVQGVRPLAGGAPRDYLLYLPLYNGIESLEIGVSNNATLEGAPPRDEKPIVFYGTSIMHGACASRPGMSISSILGRRLGRPTINLGFSGNGTMDASMGEFLVELDPAVYAIDCLPNMNGQQVTQRCRALVEQLQTARPQTPILLVEDRINTGGWLRNGAAKFHRENHAALKTAYQQMVADGVANLHYLDGTDLLGGDGEAATDGSHPNDMGMVRYADAYEPVLRNLLASND
jgi:lysophospholipase L1-like esterase